MAIPSWRMMLFLNFTLRNFHFPDRPVGRVCLKKMQYEIYVVSISTDELMQ